MCCRRIHDTLRPITPSRCPGQETVRPRASKPMLRSRRQLEAELSHQARLVFSWACHHVGHTAAASILLKRWARLLTQIARHRCCHRVRLCRLVRNRDRAGWNEPRGLVSRAGQETRTAPAAATAAATAAARRKRAPGLSTLCLSLTYGQALEDEVHQTCQKHLATNQPPQPQPQPLPLPPLLLPVPPMFDRRTSTMKAET